MLKKFLSKITRFAAILAILVQVFGPSASVASLTFAQEATPSPTDQATPSPSENPTPVPNPTIMPSPDISPSPTLTPSPDPTIETTPTPTDQPSSNPGNTSELKSGSMPTDTSGASYEQSTPLPSVEVSPTARSTVTPLPDPTEDGQLSVSILHNNSPPQKSLDLSYSDSSSASLTTDKADYTPTDTAIISGSAFKSNHQYKIVISSQDAPAVTHEDTVTTDDNGDFTYAYQLDGNYRPNYTVEVKDGDEIIASTTFTDSANPALSWPSSWITPNACTTDPSDDENPDNIDLVGTSGNPAVGFNSDSNYQYFREKVHGNPGSASNPVEKAWVLLFQTSTPQYQYLGSLNGKDDKVQLWQNTSPAGAVDFSPLLNDPAETKVWEGSSADYARITAAGGGDYFVDWAIPLSQLTSRGITASTTKFFATSADANNFNKDHLNCYEAISDLSIVKTDSPDPVNSGGVLTYTLSIYNNGPDTSTGVVVNDNLPAGYTVTSVTPNQGSCSDITEPTLQCELGAIGNGGNAIVTVVGVVTGSGTITNSALVSSTTLDTNTSNNADTEDTTIIQKGSLTVHKTFTDQHSNSNITINLSGEDLGTTSTNDSGDATFSNLNAGTYTAHATEPAGYYESANTCINVSVVTGPTASCTITDSPMGSISGFKYSDYDGSLQTTNDVTGVSNWTINLYSCLTDFSGCIFQATLPTNNSGAFSFTNLLPGFYKISEVVKSGWINLTPTFINLTLSADQDSSNNNFVNFNLGQISGKKYNDLNGDGEDQAGEPGLSGWTIYIDANSNGVLDNSEQFATTDANGNYALSNLGPGIYRIRELTQNSWHQSDPTAADTAIGGQSDGSYLVTMTNNGNKTQRNFGNYRNATISVVKDVRKADGNDTEDSHSFTAQLNGGNEQAIAEGTDAVYPVTPGTYTISEVADDDYDPRGCQLPTGADATNFTVTSGQTLTITCTNNQKLAKITVEKDVVRPDGITDISDNHTFQVTLNGETKSFSENNSAIFEVDPGTYSASESDETDYSLISNGGPATVTSNGSAVIHMVNKQKPASITVTKETSPSVTRQLFTFNLSGLASDSASIASGASHTFEGLWPGIYTLGEQILAGWNLSSALCDEQTFENNSEITIAVGQNITCTFNNAEQTPVLRISKSNDTGGVDKHPSDSVNFTITVSLDRESGPASGVEVTDLLPDGFKYHSDSWGASSSIHGVLALSEPTYHSPGVWSIGNMDPGEVITLTYKADISSDQQAGLYKDLAWAQGTSADSSTVLALAVDPGMLATNFVGTSVNVVRDNQSGGSINVETKQEGQVLGASISLPATGSQTIWLVVSAFLFITGICLATAGLKLRRKNG